jgi:hypothetical protein
VVESRSNGLAECVIRIRENEPPLPHLQRAFAALYRLYGPRSVFEVSVTGIFVLQGFDNLLSVWYGHDYGSSRPLAQPFVVRRLSDVGLMNTTYTVHDFEETFFRNRSTSRVRVHSVVALLFIVRHHLDNFQRDRTTEGGKWTKLY